MTAVDNVTGNLGILVTQRVQKIGFSAIRAKIGCTSHAPNNAAFLTILNLHAVIAFSDFES